MSIRKKIYSDMFTRIIGEFNDDFIVFLFGFSIEAYEVLNEIGIKHFNDHELRTGEAIYNQLCPKDKIRKRIFSVKGKNWGFYEEFIDLNNKLNSDLSDLDLKVIIIENNIYKEKYPIDNIEDISKFIFNIKDESIDNKSSVIDYYVDYQFFDEQLYVMYINFHSSNQRNEKSNIEVFRAYDFLDQQLEVINLNNKLSIGFNDLSSITRKLENGLFLNTEFILESTSLINQIDEINREKLDPLNKLGSYYNVHFNFENQIENREHKSNQDYLYILKKYWNSSDFRMLKFYDNPYRDNNVIEVSQNTLIVDIVNQSRNADDGKSYSDIIITAPTGAGKSLLFQIPAIYLHENFSAVTIVVTPLIALMEDQVTALNSRGIKFATYINSNITFEQRQNRIQDIKSGLISIVYISPESLLSNDIRTYIGDRKIGLFVVDEAHIVTSWGRDFRVDYWFLGDFIEKTRKGSHLRAKQKTNTMEFPVICLTATAVFNGRDDVILDLQKSLNINVAPNHIYVGNVRRENINFNIVKHINKEHSKEINEEKAIVTSLSVKDFLRKNEKTIVYFPYVSQITNTKNQLTRILNKEELDKVKVYVGKDMDKFDKNDSYNYFKDIPGAIMLSTKAFGMGVDISDISSVYHFAPTGTLSDYVQEIGRAARDPKMTGTAKTDYYPKDMRYANTLWGLSGLKHFQLKFMLKKILEMYEINHHKNMLISPDVFSSIFTDQIENKAKSGLMLIASDLYERYNYKVLVVRPSNMFTIHYININFGILDEFKIKFGNYIEPVSDHLERTKEFRGTVTEIIRKTGQVYEIKLSKLWEEKFSDISYAKFKYDFFSGNLFEFKDMVHPRTKLIIHYLKDFSTVTNAVEFYGDTVHEIFHILSSTFGKQNFTFVDFERLFKEKIKINLGRDFIRVLLEMFTLPYSNGSSFIFEKEPTEDWRFLRKVKSDTEFIQESSYTFASTKFSYISSNIKRYIHNSYPNQGDNSFVAYLGIPRGENAKRNEELFMASFLEMFGLATFELEGGKNAQVFVRINDSMILNRIVNSREEYRNRILSEIEVRHKRAAKIVEGFLMSDLKNEARWDVIENYFLGNDGVVDNMLNIGE